MTIFAAVLAVTLASAAPKGFDPEANMTVNDSGGRGYLNWAI